MGPCCQGVLLLQILENVGLCVCFYDFVHIADAYVYSGEGAATVEGRASIAVPCHTDVSNNSISRIFAVLFRLVVFRPVEGEVIEGRVRACDETGVQGRVCIADVEEGGKRP